MIDYTHNLSEATECRPYDCRFLSLNLLGLGLVSKQEAIYLEKLMTRPFVVLPPSEQQIPLSDVNPLDGPAKAISLFLSSKTTFRHLAPSLMKLCRVKYN